VFIQTPMVSALRLLSAKSVSAMRLRAEPTESEAAFSSFECVALSAILFSTDRACCCPVEFSGTDSDECISGLFEEDLEVRNRRTRRIDKSLSPLFKLGTAEKSSWLGLLRVANGRPDAWLTCAISIGSAIRNPLSLALSRKGSYSIQHSSNYLLSPSNPAAQSWCIYLRFLFASHDRSRDNRSEGGRPALIWRSLLLSPVFGLPRLHRLNTHSSLAHRISTKTGQSTALVTDIV
jgi:hypothetical protein